MARATLTEYFDSNSYSLEYVTETLEKYGKNIIPDPPSLPVACLSMSTEEYARWEMSNSRMYSFYWNHYHLRPHDDSFYMSFPMAEKSETAECPDSLLPLFLKAAADGLPLLVRKTDMTAQADADRAFERVMSRYGTCGKLFMPKSMNHLATKVSVSGYDYWIAANSFFTACMRSRGLIPRKEDMLQHVSCAGWITEDRTNGVPA